MTRSRLYTAPVFLTSFVRLFIQSVHIDTRLSRPTRPFPGKIDGRPKFGPFECLLRECVSRQTAATRMFDSTIVRPFYDWDIVWPKSINNSLGTKGLSTKWTKHNSKIPLKTRIMLTTLNETAWQRRFDATYSIIAFSPLLSLHRRTLSNWELSGFFSIGSASMKSTGSRIRHAILHQSEYAIRGAKISGWRNEHERMKEVNLHNWETSLGHLTLVIGRWSNGLTHSCSTCWLIVAWDSVANQLKLNRFSIRLSSNGSPLEPVSKRLKFVWLRLDGLRKDDLPIIYDLCCLMSAQKHN